MSTATVRPETATPATDDGDGAVGDPRPSRARRLWAGSWRLGVALMTGLVAFAVVWPSTDMSGWSDARVGASIVGDVLAGSAALVLVPFRHRAPFAVTLVVVGLASFSTLAVGAAALAVVSLATRRRPGEIVATGAVFVAATVVAELVVFRSTDDGTSVGWTAVVLGAIVLAYALLALVGVVIGSRRALVSSLRERARLVERDQALREERARDGERAHLAREMHDVLGHRLSLVALHAGALEYRGRDLDPDETVAAAAVVRAEAHSALSDLRDVLGVLRDPEAGGASEVTVTAPPQPTLLELDALVDEAREAGSSVTSSIDDSERLAEVPTTVGRHAYRIVQEALTNARRHAAGQPIRVSVAVATTDVVRIRVTNPAPDVTTENRTGHGLAGLAERVRLVDGHFRAGPDGDGFVVEADLPWTR
ncbi:sensor histidine kinase [Frigoribacterium sp. R86507]|uniref:sensor histidine kinase n=1 Tax=Frigoribacterium sp. R86507 TaxID=3093850 RepID=UPI0037CA05D7